MTTVRGARLELSLEFRVKTIESGQLHNSPGNEGPN